MAYYRYSPGYLWILGLSRRISMIASSKVRLWPPRDYEIGDQLQRAADSIGLNIAEGYARAHYRGRKHFYTRAEGSLEEALHAVRMAEDRGLLSGVDASTLAALLLRLNSALQNFVRTALP